MSVQLLDYVHLLEDGYDNFLPWLPLVAPELQGGLEANPLQAYRTGSFHRIPIIIGSVMNETDAWIPKVLNDTIHDHVSSRFQIFLHFLPRQCCSAQYSPLEPSTGFKRLPT